MRSPPLQSSTEALPARAAVEGTSSAATEAHECRTRGLVSPPAARERPPHARCRSPCPLPPWKPPAAPGRARRSSSTPGARLRDTKRREREHRNARCGCSSHHDVTPRAPSRTGGAAPAGSLGSFPGSFSGCGFSGTFSGAGGPSPCSAAGPGCHGTSSTALARAASLTNAPLTTPARFTFLRSLAQELAEAVDRVGEHEGHVSVDELKGVVGQGPQQERPANARWEDEPRHARREETRHRPPKGAGGGRHIVNPRHCWYDRLAYRMCSNDAVMSYCEKRDARTARGRMRDLEICRLRPSELVSREPVLVGSNPKRRWHSIATTEEYHRDKPLSRRGSSHRNWVGTSRVRRAAVVAPLASSVPVLC